MPNPYFQSNQFSNSPFTPAFDSSKNYWTTTSSPQICRVNPVQEFNFMHNQVHLPPLHDFSQNNISMSQKSVLPLRRPNPPKPPGDNFASGIGLIGALGGTGQEYLTWPSGWRSAYLYRPKNMSRWQHFRRNISGKMYSPKFYGNQFTETKSQVLRRVSRFSKIGNVFTVLSISKSAYDGITAGWRGDTLGTIEPLADLLATGVWYVGGVYGKAFSLGYSIGSFLDDSFGWSGKIADAAFRWTHPEYEY